MFTAGRLFSRLVACSLLLACGESTRRSFDSPTGAPETTPDGGSAPVFGKDVDGSVPPVIDDCSEAAKLVYVLSDADDLFSFAPDKKIFTKLGHLDCPGGNTPNSMAVDRSGTAWVNYSNGMLFKVSTKDASCETTPFSPGQSGFLKFGMAFSTKGAATKEETLYVANNRDEEPALGLGVIDLKTFVLTPIGNYSGALSSQNAELTGTGDGRLYGFFATEPTATLALIDPATGATSQDKILDGVDTGYAWAFSFWGGDFWFYTVTGTSSKVTRLHASGDGSLEVVIPDVGNMRIVGAGVSTCAPLTQPH